MDVFILISCWTFTMITRKTFQSGIVPSLRCYDTIFGQKYPFPSFLSSVVRVWSNLCNLVRVCETSCDFVRFCATLCVSVQPFASASLFRPLTPPSTGIAIKIHLRVFVRFCATLCSFGYSAVFQRCSPQRLSYTCQQAIHILELILT